MTHFKFSDNDPIVIVAAKRTAIGSFLGTLSNTPADQLGAHVIKTVLDDVCIEPDSVDQVLMGQVLTAAAGQNPARQAAIQAGIPESKTAITINQVCGSGLRTVAMAAGSVALGESNIVIAGGQENMSLSPHAAHLRSGHKFGDASLTDTMIKDGLWDKFNDYHMGQTAENIAEKYNISREKQDEFAAMSQMKAGMAIEQGKFKNEITPITVKQRREEITFDTDQFPRPKTTAEKLSNLKPAFKKDGTVTAGNASGLNDGAAATIIMRQSKAEKLGLEPLARIVSWATKGVDPAVMGTGPIPASKAALEAAGWDVHDLDLAESNEAFAAQSCAVLQELDLSSQITNIHGGAIALGHPIGASGTRCLVTLIHALRQEDANKGLVTLCIGGGMGIAMCIER